MTTGLNERELELMRVVFARHAEVQRAVLFGSRAKGTFTVNSDVDIAIEGIATPLQIAAIALELGELPMPYKFDVVAAETIHNQALREHVQRVGMVIYTRPL